MKDTKIRRKNKSKSSSKKKTNSVSAKKLKRPAKKKAKSVTGKKVKESAKAKTKSAAKKNVRKISVDKPKVAVGKNTKKSIKPKTKIPVKTPIVEEKITHGEDLHLIPVEGEIHPIDSVESHRIENLFQNREEVTLQQENQKVKNALGSRKNLTRNFRIIRHK